MKTPAYLRTVLTLSLVVPASAFAGGFGTGGENGKEVDGQEYVVEDFYVPPTDLRGSPGFALFQEKLKLLRQAAPGMAGLVEQRVGDRFFYAVPDGNFEEVSRERTGLAFKTKQQCYQNQTEIFCDKDMLAKMGPTTTAKLFAHEFLMANLDDKQSEKVRAIVNLLFAAKPDVAAIQDELARQGFGAYLSPRLGEIEKKYQRLSVIRNLTTLVEEGEFWCNKGSSFEQIRKELVEGDTARAFSDDEHATGFLNPFARKLDDAAYAAYGPAQFCEAQHKEIVDNLCFMNTFKPNQSLHPSYDVVLAEEYGPNLCQELEAMKKAAKSGTALENGALRASALEGFNSLDAWKKSDSFQFHQNALSVYEELAGDPAFAQVASLVADSRLSGKKYAELAHLHTAVANAYLDADGLMQPSKVPAAARRQKLCDSLASLHHRLDGMEGKIAGSIIPNRTAPGKKVKALEPEPTVSPAPTLGDPAL